MFWVCVGQAGSSRYVIGSLAISSVNPLTGRSEAIMRTICEDIIYQPLAFSCAQGLSGAQHDL